MLEPWRNTTEIVSGHERWKPASQVHEEEVTLKPRFPKIQEKSPQNEIYSPGPMILNFLPVELQQMDFCGLNYQVGGI